MARHASAARVRSRSTSTLRRTVPGTRSVEGPETGEFDARVVEAEFDHAERTSCPKNAGR